MKRDQIFLFHRNGHPMNKRKVKFIKQSINDPKKCIVKVVDPAPGFSINDKLIVSKNELGATGELQVGDDVTYAKKFLRSIAAGPTDDMWFAKGTITNIHHVGDTQLATIQWNDPEIPKKVNVANLTKAGVNSD